MRLYISSIVNQLRNYSASLEKTSIFIDKPWALIDDEMSLQKLIFKNDKELILSKNGQVQIGKWDYLPQANSLLIDRSTDKILCKAEFIESAVMILKLDGTENKYFILANENIIPDLDVQSYLDELRRSVLRIEDLRLSDERTLEVQREFNQTKRIDIGNIVLLDSTTPNDGTYELAQKDKMIEILDGRINKILTKKIYTTPTNEKLVIHQQNSAEISRGDYAFLYGDRIFNATVNFSQSKQLIVRHGEVIKLEPKTLVGRLFEKLGQLWNKALEI